jgi:hypothetical protein
MIGWDGDTRQGYDVDRAKKRRRNHAWPAGDTPGRAPSETRNDNAHLYGPRA